MKRLLHCGLGVLLLAVGTVQPVWAQTPDADDRAIDLAQPDFTLVALPTTLRVPRFRGAFRVTHRFTRPLGDGDFGSLAEDLFGLDSGAQIGLEFRFGIRRGTQVGVHRTSDRTIEFFAQHEVKAQGGRLRVTVSALASTEGTNNFRDSYSPVLGAVVSRTIATRAAVYLEPIWVNNSNHLPSEVVDHNDTFLLGVGARLRIRPSVYVSFEASPRVAGYDPDAAQMSFGLETRVGGHLFQLNFSNGFGTTFGQLARGGTSYDDWYLGFNISRKFF